MKCSKVFHPLRVGGRTFGALSWRTLIQARQCQVAQSARNDFGPYAWRSGGIGRGPRLLRLICHGGCR